MKSITKICLILITALTMAAYTAQAQADATTTTNTPAAKPKPKSKRYAGKVTSVDQDAKTITLTAAGKDHTLKVTSATVIKKDGEPAMLTDVTVGEHVYGQERVNDAGDLVARTVNIGQPKPKAAATPPPTAPPAAPPADK
jgi:hypothetical protein